MAKRGEAERYRIMGRAKQTAEGKKKIEEAEPKVVEEEKRKRERKRRRGRGRRSRRRKRRAGSFVHTFHFFRTSFFWTNFDVLNQNNFLLI